MRNILLISPDFPYTYYQFARAFKNNGMNVLAIGGTPYENLHPELKNNVTKYFRCNDMNNFDYLCSVVGWLIDEFGPIDYVESNNEYWLQTDAKIREKFRITNGILPNDLYNYQRKSSLKKYYEQAGVKIAPYLLIDNYENLEKFANKFGFPLFIKPDTGVGAGGNCKINNFEELRAFYDEKQENCSYICEVYVESSAIITYDGIVNYDSEVVIDDSMVCPPSIFNIKNKGEDMFYYVNKDIDPLLQKLGRKILKAMGLKARFFHMEFFIATNDCEGYFSKGDYVGIEVNIRTPGGFTPDLIDFAVSSDIHQVLADVVCFNRTSLSKGECFYSCCASRRDGNSYFFNDEDIRRTFRKELRFCGRYPDIFSDIMGNTFYMAIFKDLNEANLFKEYVSKNMSASTSSYQINHLVGEDRRIMREKRSSIDDGLSICDKHIDGA